MLTAPDAMPATDNRLSLVFHAFQYLKRPHPSMKLPVPHCVELHMSHSSVSYVQATLVPGACCAAVCRCCVCSVVGAVRADSGWLQLLTCHNHTCL